MSSLKGKTAFVSGGTRGIGLAIAKRLASEGADIMVAGSSEANCAAATRAITAHSDGRIEAHAADLRTLEGCQAVFDAHSRVFGGCDILVHSAGATRGGVFPDQDDADFIDGFALKFHAGVRLSRLFWPWLAAAHGNVVMIVGGNIRHSTRVMTTSIALATSMGELAFAMALGIVLLLVALVVNIASQILRNSLRNFGHDV